MKGKKILLGITGSIAAYKIPELVRMLIKEGAEVKIVMTPAATSFVSPLVLSTLSRNKVQVEMFAENVWSNHVQLGRWADLFIIAPLSADTLAKMATGFCDNFLLAVYLSATCPVFAAPAMDEDMWHHAATRKNITQLLEFGHKIIDVENGELASGLVGEGRMAVPQTIFQKIKEHFRDSFFTDKKVLVTMGPTYEAIDPVRYIGNHSSGKMGMAIAENFFMQGAQVQIISGPVHVTSDFKDIQVQSVTNAEEMFNAVKTSYTDADIIVMAAAVADYKPLHISAQKIKKNEKETDLQLVKNEDILHWLGNIKSPGQLIIGFALETNDAKQNALNKLNTKKADMIVLNTTEKGSGFSGDTNKVIIFDNEGNEFPSKLTSKKEIAGFIVDVVKQKLGTKKE